uniref:Uncharacterized protein n=1 Tax=Acrobeloides nanus TaxID=290746 RepID=A0A914D134_9BILA
MTNILGAFFLVIFSWCQVLAEQANENVFPICLESDELWNAVAVENPTKNTQPLHVGVLPSTVGSSFQITLHENSSIPTLDYTDTLSSTDGSVSKIPPLSYCYLRLEACSHCNIHLEYESPLHYLNDTESDQLLACHELGHIHQPCFSLEFVEERGDRAIGLLNSFETEVGHQK